VIARLSKQSSSTTLNCKISEACGTELAIKALPNVSSAHRLHKVSSADRLMQGGIAFATRNKRNTNTGGTAHRLEGQLLELEQGLNAQLAH